MKVHGHQGRAYENNVRPKLFAELIRALKDQPDHAVLWIVREVRDGNW
jgi:hypothetical protein